MEYPEKTSKAPAIMGNKNGSLCSAPILLTPQAIDVDTWTESEGFVIRDVDVVLIPT